jgi:uncharacterized protein involved in cysteine biosynthesis
MTRIMQVATIINVLIWSALVWTGWDGLANVVAQRVEGYPNHAQTVYYLYIPLGMVAVTLAGYALSRVGKARYIALIIEILVLVAVLPYLLPYGGGV